MSKAKTALIIDEAAQVFNKPRPSRRRPVTKMQFAPRRVSPGDMTEKHQLYPREKAHVRLLRGHQMKAKHKGKWQDRSVYKPKPNDYAPIASKRKGVTQ